MSDRCLYLTTLAYGQLSVLELASIEHSGIFDLKLVASDDRVALIECDQKTAGVLMTRIGGSYKLAKVCGSSIESVLERLVLPENPKFAWTISGYGISPELLDETRQSMRSVLKERSLGKSRYINPEVDIPKRNLPNSVDETRELKLRELNQKVLHPSGTQSGFDIVVASDRNKGETYFGFTIKTSDHKGFENRDFSRSYQNPTMTIGPRLARVLVNLAMSKQSGCLFDPFCGLGTILQEALVLGYDVCGVDVSSTRLERCKANLNWLRSHFGITPSQKQLLIRSDAVNLHKGDTPTIDGVATEPILLPVFARNPSHNEGAAAIKKVASVYRKNLESLRGLLNAGTRVALVTPTIVDSAGRELSIELDQLVSGSNYMVFEPRLSQIESRYPLRVRSSRKKTIQRDVYLMEAV